MARAVGARILGALCAASMIAPMARADETVSNAAPAKPLPKTVYLYGAADLEHLRETNFDHYQRAQRILAKGEELCRPGPPTVQYTQSDARDLHCQSSVLLTSNPPKKQLEFRLDEVRYIALITLTGEAPRLVKADEGKPTAAAPPPPQPQR